MRALLQSLFGRFLGHADSSANYRRLLRERLLLDAISTVLMMFLLLMIVSLISGCTTVATISEKSMDFDESLLQDCPRLPQLKDSTDTAIQEHNAEVYRLYNACASQKLLENREIRKALNIKPKL